MSDRSERAHMFLLGRFGANPPDCEDLLVAFAEGELQRVSLQLAEHELRSRERAALEIAVMALRDVREIFSNDGNRPIAAGVAANAHQAIVKIRTLVPEIDL